MPTIRTAAAVLAVLAASALLVGSVGFSGVSAERGVSVSVVDDDRAYLGYDSSDLTVADGDRVAMVTVANRLFDDVSVTNVAIESTSVTFANPSEPTLEPGESAVIEGTVGCAPGDAETVEVTVTLEGEGVVASIYGDTVTRAFEVACPDTDAANETTDAGADGTVQTVDGENETDS